MGKAGGERDASRKVAAALEEIPEVLFAYLFGSHAGGGTHALSDLDVAVYPDPGVRAEDDEGADADADLLSRLEGRLRRHFPNTEVDLVLLDRAPPLLAERVVRTGEVVVSRDEARRIRWIVGVKSRYCDLRPLRRRLDRALERRVRTGAFGRTVAAGGGAEEGGG